MKRQRSLPEFYLIFEMKPGRGKDFIHDHNSDFQRFKDINDLISYFKDAVSREEEHPVFYQCIKAFHNDDCVAFRYFL